MTVKLLTITILSLAGVVGGVVAADLLIRFMFQQRIIGTGIDIMLLGKWPVQHIAFSDIVDIRRCSFGETLRPRNLFGAIRFGIYGQSGGIVLLRLRQGIGPRVLPEMFRWRVVWIFPYDPDAFIGGIRRHLSDRGSQ
jgi:hypothetical protein